MRKVLVFGAVVFGLLASQRAQAQSALPRSSWVGNASSSNGGDVPAHAFDGTLSSRWSSGANQSVGQWFTVDFGVAQTFTQVTLDVGGNTNDYARGYELYVSNDAVSWTGPVASGTGATGIMTIVFPAQTSRFIGIVQTGTSSSNWWSIAELNVYSGTVPTAPLPTSGWVATATVSGSGDPPGNAIDGNLSTRFSTDASQASGQSFQVDMRSPQLVAGLVMDSGSNSSDYARAYQVFGSSDGINWGSAIAAGTGASSPITVYFAQTTARYLKIALTTGASNWWSIGELSVLTPTTFTPSASVLPRLGWSASASASGSGNGPANALDDNGGTRWSTGANQANGQSFTLDMLAPRSFTKVTLDTGSGNTGDYPRGYQVFVSSDGSTWGSAVATGSGSSQVTTITFGSQSARYIKAVQTGTSSTNSWSIAELNVYGVPPSVLVRDAWTATASLNSSNAQLGIDGNVSTQWSTNTAQVNGQSFQIDMKVAQSFNEITLDVNCNPADYPRGYQVFASNSTSNWGAAIASGSGFASMIAVAFAPQSARYLKVVQTSTSSNYWGLAELNVLNTNPLMCSAPCVAQDACHDVGTCNPSTGVCSNPAKTNGTTCNDGNACTQTDTCQAGVCTGSNPVTCTASDQCHAVGTCNTSSGVCSNPAAANGTACSDGNACTHADTCQSGVCTAGSAVTCTASDQCHSAGTCDPASGVCSNPAKANGTMCSDGNACTQTDACQAGVCTGGNPVACAASDQCHAAGVCDPSSGTCSNPAVANGTSCSDGNACTQTDSCQAGTCTGSSPVTCTTSDQCHVAGACNPATGACSNPVAANGTACSDGNACTQTDTCQAGVCAGGNPVTCAASDQCHVAGACNPSTGACSNPSAANGTSCSDGNACTQTDSCQSGVCAGSNPVTCAASDQCHAAGACNPSTGVCSNPAKVDGTSCSDGNACTQTDTCVAGTCIGSSPITCTASDQCHSAGTCDPTSGACSNPTKANGTACSDGNACTQTDTCQSGTCTGGNPVSCTASDQCHGAGTCDPTSGACTNPAKTDGTSCSDGNACTQTDTCVAGTCTGGNPVTCTASDQCHAVGTCNPSSGVCSNPTKADGTGCSDGNACTQTDTCVAGTCTGGNAVTCTAADQCHSVGTCDPTSGVCSNPTKANGTACSDGNACTQTDTCVSGTCTGSNPVTCVTSDQCHVAGTCSPPSGMCSNPSKADGTTCDDGNPATSSDQCTSGICAGAAMNSCPPPSNSCLQAGIRDPATGVCSYPFKRNFIACDDGNPATIDDLCQSGTCLGQFPCTNVGAACDDGDPCTTNDFCSDEGTCSGEPINCGSGINACGGYCDHTTGACKTAAPDGSQCDDRNACTTGDACSAGVCVGTGSCSSTVTLTGVSYSGVAQPSFSVGLTSDHTSVHPGESVAFTGQVTFDGASFLTSGEIDIVNRTPSGYVVPGYSVTLEYLSAVSNEWVPLAGVAYDAVGQVKPPTAPYELSFQPFVFGDTGVVIPRSGLPGTTIASGATASLFINPNDGIATLPAQALAILADPAQAVDLREAFRIDAGPGLPDGGELLTTFDFPVGQELVVSNVQGQINFANNTFPATSTSPASLSPGATATFTGVATAPAAKPASAFTVTGFLNGYQNYLQQLVQTPNVASSNVIVDGPGFGTGSYANNDGLALPNAIPIVVSNVVFATTNPVVVENGQFHNDSISGFPETWAMTISNPGTETATDINIQGANLVDQGGSPETETAEPKQTTVTAPTNLSPGAAAQGSIYYQSTAGVDQLIVMIAPTTWKDAIGNVYGPMWGTGWGVFFQAPVPLGILALGGQPSTPEPVTSVLPLAATAVLPNGQPAIGVNVQLTVTGANAQVLSAVTDAAGVAHFPFKGLLPGGDSFIATATITTAAIQSNTTNVFWTAPYGAPCVGTDGPLDVVVVIDTSSSMEGAPLDGAKAATLAFLNTMDLSRDQLAVVSFGGVASLNVGLTSDFPTASAGIASVEPGGNGFINPTNIGAGLSAALDELASSRARSTATPMIVFVSDGGNSFGDPEPALARLKASGIRTVVFGLAEADTIMLNRIASSKNDYYYTPTADELSWLYSALGQNICRNQVPLVHAGGDQGAYGVTLPHTLTLQGEVHDDGPVGDPRLTSEWSVVSGPGTVTFVDASSPVTTALFTTPGTYVLQLEANDGTYTGTDQATVTVDTEPSLAGASLVANLGTPSPLTVGTSESLILTLTDASARPIADFPIQVTITGPNAATSTLTTDANGTATLTYASQVVGTDVLSAVALGITQLAAAPVSVSWTAAGSEQVVTQGWIGGPTHQSTVTGSTPITIGSGITLTSGTVTYWPLSAPDQVHTLATGVSGNPGATIATLDTTVLANGPWVVKLDGTDSAGASQVSEVSVTVSGDYKPGRVVVEETEFTIPLTGMPLTVGRRYDSLQRDNVGDFGHGWSLTLGSPQLEVDPAHNVTITMPDGRRVTFYFQATSLSNSVAFSYLLQPGYVPEAGTFGSLTSDGCDVMIVANGDDLVCFIDGSLDYAPTTYKYTDPYGRVFTMGASGELKSIEDKQQNVLTFTPTGISGTEGVTMAITRDSSGRITEILTPALGAGNNKLGYLYAYDAAGDLSTVTLATGGLVNYTYDADHFLLTTKDPLGNLARTSTYDTSGRLATDTDALGNVTSYAYDLDARKTTITNPDTGTVQQTFDDRGLLLTEVDPLGRTTQHTYDANRNELTRTNALNEVSTFTYDSNGNQTSTSNGRGETTHITYNAFSQPLTSKDPSGHTTTIAYDELGIPTQFSDEVGTLATFTSSEHGLPLTVTDAAGNTAYLTYDPSGDLTSRTDRLGRLTQYNYDGIGRRTQTFDPRGGSTDYFYDGEGNLVKSFDALGAVHGWQRDGDENITFESLDNNFFPYQRGTQHFYDADNHLTKDVYFDGTTTLYTRDFRGNKLTEKDESGRVTTYQYDKAGELTKTTFADGTFTTRAYDDLGRLATATDERGNATTYEYETGCGCADRVTKVTDALGRATTTAYDSVGRRSSVTDAAGHTTGYAYDSRGHLTETDYADGTKETDTFDVLGRRTAHTDQMGSVTQYGYDAEDQLTSVTDALSNVTRYSYDLSGNLASVTDANNHVTSYAYDLLNRKSGRTLPLGQSETFAYDIVGNEVSHADFRGKTSIYNFDHRDRLLTKVPDPTLAEPTVTFTYNPTGTRANMVDASGTTTYGYDTRDRLLTKATPAGTLTYTYDPAGNVASILSSNANGTSVNYAWDAANQLVSVTDNRAGGVTTAAYTVTGRPSTLAQPSGVGATYSYDTRDRVTSLAWQRGTNPAFGSWSYDFNGRGQRTSVTDATGRQVAYGYDAISRLASETITSDSQGAVGNGELSYSLDPTGNRLTRTSTLAALGAQTFTYDANDQLATDGYDANGNTTSSAGHTYAYDFENRLRSKDGGAVTIVYDGDGNRVAKTVGGATTKYLVDELNPTGYLQVLEEVAGGGVVRTEYTYGTMLVSQTRQPGSSAQTSFYGYDAHGNVTFLTDATGTVTDGYDYDAWGNLVSSAGTTPNTRLYAGEEFDPDIGFVNLRARYYSPRSGRFLALDPIGTQALRRSDQNLYLYAASDPVNRIDPAGLSEGVDFSLVVKAVAALVLTGAAIHTIGQSQTPSGINALQDNLACAFSGAVIAFDTSPAMMVPGVFCSVRWWPFSKSKSKTEDPKPTKKKRDCGPKPQPPLDCDIQAVDAFDWCMKTVGDRNYCEHQFEGAKALCEATMHVQQRDYAKALLEWSICMSETP